MSKNFSQYSIDPVTRYPNININFLQPSQVSTSPPVVPLRVWWQCFSWVDTGSPESELVGGEG